MFFAAPKIFRMAAGILGVFWGSSLAQASPFHGVLAQCFGAHDTRTAAKITELYPCLLMLSPLRGQGGMEAK